MRHVGREAFRRHRAMGVYTQAQPGAGADEVKTPLLAPKPDIRAAAQPGDKPTVRFQTLFFGIPAVLVALRERMIQIAEDAARRVLGFKSPDMGVHVVPLLAVAVTVEHGLLTDADQPAVGTRHDARSAQKILGIIMDDPGHHAREARLGQGPHGVGRIAVKRGYGQGGRRMAGPGLLKPAARGRGFGQGFLGRGAPVVRVRVTVGEQGSSGGPHVFQHGEVGGAHGQPGFDGQRKRDALARVPFEHVAGRADVLVAVQAHGDQTAAAVGRLLQTGQAGQIVGPPVAEEAFDDRPFRAVHRPYGTGAPENRSRGRVQQGQIGSGVHVVSGAVADIHARQFGRAVHRDAAPDGPGRIVGADAPEAHIVPLVREVEARERTAQQGRGEVLKEGMRAVLQKSRAFRMVLRCRAGRTIVLSGEGRKIGGGTQAEGAGPFRVKGTEDELLSGQRGAGNRPGRRRIAEDFQSVAVPHHPHGGSIIRGLPEGAAKGCPDQNIRTKRIGHGSFSLGVSYGRGEGWVPSDGPGGKHTPIDRDQLFRRPPPSIFLPHQGGKLRRTGAGQGFQHGRADTGHIIRRQIRRLIPEIFSGAAHFRQHQPRSGGPGFQGGEAGRFQRGRQNQRFRRRIGRALQRAPVIKLPDEMHPVIGCGAASGRVLDFPVLSRQHQAHAAAGQGFDQPQLVFALLNIAHAQDKRFPDVETLPEEGGGRRFKKDVVHTVDDGGEQSRVQVEQGGELIALRPRVGQDVVGHAQQTADVVHAVFLRVVDPDDRRKDQRQLAHLFHMDGKTPRAALHREKMHHVGRVELRPRIPAIIAQHTDAERFQRLHVLEKLHLAAARTVEGHGVSVEEDGEGGHLCSLIIFQVILGGNNYNKYFFIY